MNKALVLTHADLARFMLGAAILGAVLALLVAPAIFGCRA